jgi:UDP-N-acetylglucosamine:LPS N-acetylglucosamine transferase
MPQRVLIVTASVGEGHDLPARTLAAQLREERPGVEVIIEDGLAVMGRSVHAASAGAPRVLYYRLGWLWDLEYWIFSRLAPTRRLGQAALARLGAPGLARLIREHSPDVVVSTFPQTTEVLGRLRRAGHLHTPVCAAITDLAGLWYWATPGVDVHLVTHPESVAEVRRIAGTPTEVHCVHGLTDPAFLVPRRQDDARALLGLPVEGKVVLVSGGGWGVGDLSAAADVALGLERVAVVVCLCGRNDELRRRLARRYQAEGRVRVEGFTEVMPDWLAAADALVHSTAGLTILEALIRGCPAISFGWGRGHIRVNNAAFRHLGLVVVARTRTELESALLRALEERPPPDLSFAELPSAASFVLARAQGRERGSEQDARDRHDQEGKA